MGEHRDLPDRDLREDPQTIMRREGVGIFGDGYSFAHDDFRNRVGDVSGEMVRNRHRTLEKRRGE